MKLGAYHLTQNAQDVCGATVSDHVEGDCGENQKHEDSVKDDSRKMEVSKDSWESTILNPRDVRGCT